MNCIVLYCMCDSTRLVRPGSSWCLLTKRCVLELVVSKRPNVCQDDSGVDGVAGDGPDCVLFG